MFTSKRKVLVTIFIVFFANVYAQPADVKTVTARDSILRSFMDLRFGMFIHWGPVTLRGTEIGWSRNRQVAQNDYDSLYREFDPVLFDAENWVKTAKAAGMKYIVITAKHHDGFCLWPSAFTSYNISNTPYRKDVLALLAKACKKYDIKFCIYYTVLDWFNTDYPLHNNGAKRPDPQGDMQKFRQYMKNQLAELIRSYHPYMFWFDGNWESPWTQEMGQDIYAFIKHLDPSVIINNRLGKGDHKTMTETTVGDYATPEQEVGKMNMDYPWESCITICKQWSWKPNDEMKSFKQCLQTLSNTAGGNGNLLLNISPMPDGRIEQRQVNRLRQIGNWLTRNGEAVYGTKGGPYLADSTRASTRKGNRIYLHVFDNTIQQLQLKAVPGCLIKKAFFLEGGPVEFRTLNDQIILSWQGRLPDNDDSVIVLEMDCEVEKVPLIYNSAQ